MVLYDLGITLDFSEYSNSFDTLSLNNINLEVFSYGGVDTVIIYSKLNRIHSINEFMASAHKLYLLECEMKNASIGEVCLTFEGDIKESSGSLKKMDTREVRSRLIERIGKESFLEFSGMSGVSENIESAVFYGHGESMFLFDSNKSIFFVDSYPNGI